jgi:peptidyl-prolyl cis-trans isomerase SurA
MEKFTEMKPSFKVFPKSIFFSAVLVSSLFAAEKLLDRTLVTVNNEAILESDVTKFQQKLKSKSFQELFGGMESTATQNRENVLQLLVEEKIINQQVKKLELAATDQEVDGQIRAILKRNEISQAQLAARLKQLGSSMAEYKEGIKRQIERKNLIDREIRPTTEVTEEQIKHYYQRTGNTEDLDTQYKVSHILIALRAKGPAAWDDAKVKANKIYDELVKTPDQFEKAVKEYSDDSTSTDSDGSLGYLALSSMNKEFRIAVQKTPMGQITKPIKMADGYHILKVVDTKAGDFASIPKDKKEMIRGQIIGQEVEKKMTLWLERKKRESNIHRVSQNSESNP